MTCSNCGEPLRRNERTHCRRCAWIVPVAVLSRQRSEPPRRARPVAVVDEAGPLRLRRTAPVHGGVWRRKGGVS